MIKPPRRYSVTLHVTKVTRRHRSILMGVHAGLPPLSPLRAHRFHIEHDALPEYIYLKEVRLDSVGPPYQPVLIIRYGLYTERAPFDMESFAKGDLEPIEVDLISAEGKTIRTYRISGLALLAYHPFGTLDMASDAPVCDEFVFAYQECELVNNT